MKACGVVVEYNPFHNGHIHHLEEAKRVSGCDVLVAVMSPTFMQRGEPALVNKFERTKFALAYGVDLIVELPSVLAIQSANHFAAGALMLLNELKIDSLVFGSESNKLEELKKAAQISLDADYQALVKEYLKDGQRYANACNKAFKQYEIADIKLSNDILGLAYLQEIYQHDYKIEPLTIQRTNTFLATKIDSNIASATAIRSNLSQNKDITKTTPMDKSLSASKELVFYNDFFQLLSYQINILSNEQLKNIQGFNEGLEFLFKKHINQSSSIEDFINRLSSKRYPKTRIQRAITYLLCNITKDDIATIKVDYLRILGMTSAGQNYLKEIKEQTEFKIITRFSAYKTPALALEHKVSYVYSLAKPSVNYLANKEYQQPVIIKEKNDENTIT